MGSNKGFRLAGHRNCFTVLLMLDMNRGKFLSQICWQMHFQDNFNINRYPNFDLKFSNCLDNKTLGDVIIFETGRITVENLIWSNNSYEYISLNVLC